MTLTLKPLAIGSLPQDNTEDALNYIFKLFKDTPFWPQLANVNKKEDMIIQYVQNIPGIVYDEENLKYYFTTQQADFFEKLEEFYLDYDAIVNEKDFDLLEKYAITAPYSGAIEPFLNKIANTQPEYVKGHITGAFTWGTSLCDEEGRCAFFDDTFRDILSKGLALKALWQIFQFRKVAPNSQSIIFVDEPAICQYGTSAFVTVQKSEIIESLGEIVNVIQSNGAIAGIHCCGKADWELMIDIGFDMLNLDAFLYAQTLSLFPEKVEHFLQKGGYIAWGVVPTLDKEALEKIDLEKAVKIFEEAISFLVAKGIDKKLILKSSVVTPSCGAGGLSIDLAKKAMELTVKLADRLGKKYL